MTRAVFTVLALILPTHTPGAYNRAVTQTTIHTTVCVSGYSSRIRPPVSYTTTLKVAQLKLWRYRDRDPSHYEEDHFIPLSLGGSPRSHRNLWPEPWLQADHTDDYEYFLYRQLCRDRITLKQARSAIRAWKRLFG